jgi:hypothetical protein
VINRAGRNISTQTFEKVFAVGPSRSLNCGAVTP